MRRPGLYIASHRFRLVRQNGFEAGNFFSMLNSLLNRYGGVVTGAGELGGLNITVVFKL